MSSSSQVNSDGTGFINPAVLTQAYPPPFPTSSSRTSPAQAAPAMSTADQQAGGIAQPVQGSTHDEPIDLGDADDEADTRTLPLTLFKKYVQLQPGTSSGDNFNFVVLADSLYERCRKLPVPPDNAEALAKVEARKESFVNMVYNAITSAPENPDAVQTRMLQQFEQEAKAVKDREVVMMQLSANVVRVTIDLHEEKSDGVRAEAGVPVHDPLHIGDHVRDDRRMRIGIDGRDNKLVATKRLRTVCIALQKYKSLAAILITNTAAIPELVAFPYAMSAHVVRTAEEGMAQEQRAEGA